MIKTEQILIKQIEELNKKIAELNKDVKSQDEVIKQLSEIYKDFLEFIEQKSASNPYIDSKFIPHITIENTDKNFFDVPGTAKPVVLSVAYYTSLLKYSILNKTFLPLNLMLDGISKGRQTNPQHHSDVIDIHIYNKMCIFWKKLVEDNPQKEIQIIISDNAKMPPELEEDILITFDKTGHNGARKGLIDDL